MAVGGDDNGGIGSDEGVFSDEAHMYASLRQFDPSIMQSLRNENSAILDEQEAIKHDPQQDEDALLVDAVTQLQKAAGETPTQQEGRGQSELLKAALVNQFSAGEEATVLKVLNKIDSIQDKQYTKGFKEINFTAGVANCFIVSYVFGRYPEHFWLVYLVESLYFIPSKYINMIRARPLNEAFYYFDFCWMMNFNAIFVFLLLISPIPIPEAARSFVIRGAFGICCGPLLGAAAILPFVAFVFHDLNTMTNVVIHALPPMVFYTIRWHGDEIREAWPNIFKLKHLDNPDFFPSDKGPFFLPGSGLGSIAGNTVLIYLLWFIPYVSWMLLVGLDLPRKNQLDGKAPVYDTVFHSFWRVGACQTAGRLLWKRPIAESQKQMEVDDYEVRDFLVYIGIHATLVLLSIPTLAFACNYNKHLHVAIMLIVLIMIIHRGSQRYTYYTTKMYSRVIRKEFLDKKK